MGNVPANCERIRCHAGEGNAPTHCEQIRCHAGDCQEQEDLSSCDSDRLAAKVLAAGNVKLVSARWLLGRSISWIIRRHQEMPAEAFVPSKQAARMYQRGELACGSSYIVALSYCWLTQVHPDPTRVHLELVKQYLRIHMQAVAPEEDVGLFWDFASLPQGGADGEPRTPTEEESFRKGLAIINLLYGSEKAVVLQLKDLPLSLGHHDEHVRPKRREATRLRPTPYHMRGWCFFEESLASTLKLRTKLLDLSLISEAELSDLSQHLGATEVQRPALKSKGDSPGLFSETIEERAHRQARERMASARQQSVALGEERWLSVADRCASVRQPPLHPDAFAKQLESKVLAHFPDRGLLIEKYREFFFVECRHAMHFDFSNSSSGPGWSGLELPQFAQALQEFKNCRILDLGMHLLGDEGLMCIAGALPELRLLEELLLDGALFEQQGLDALCEGLSGMRNFRRLVLSRHLEKLHMSVRHQAILAHTEFVDCDGDGRPSDQAHSRPVICSDDMVELGEERCHDQRGLLLNHLGSCGSACCTGGECPTCERTARYASRIATTCHGCTLESEPADDTIRNCPLPSPRRRENISWPNGRPCSKIGLKLGQREKPKVHQLPSAPGMVFKEPPAVPVAVTCNSRIARAMSGTLQGEHSFSSGTVEGFHRQTSCSSTPTFSNPNVGRVSKDFNTKDDRQLWKDSPPKASNADVEDRSLDNSVPKQSNEETVARVRGATESAIVEREPAWASKGSDTHSISTSLPTTWDIVDDLVLERSPQDHK